MKVILTQKEADLIEMIRNFKKSYPNGEPEMRCTSKSCSMS